MAQRLEVQHRFPGITLWVLAMATVVFASGAFLIVSWNPRVLPLALAAGLVAFVARGAFARARAAVHHRTLARAAAVEEEASSAVANAGLALAAIAVAPLIAFAVLWMSLLLLLGATWLLHALRMI